MKTIAVVLGTRPEAIKLAPVILRLREAGLPCVVCATGQHRELANDVLVDFGIKPDVCLDVMSPGQSLAQLTSRLLDGLDGFFQEADPGLAIVQGDTTTALAGALAAFYRKIPVAHVEAGLRTHDIRAPWPEEANRAMVARISDVHFAPTAAASENLLREGIDPARIHVTGNTAIDALLWMREHSPAPATLDSSQPFVLITAHRREHFGERFDAICEAIADLADLFPQTQFVYPVHPNPNVSDATNRILRNGTDRRLRHRNVRLIEPVRYSQFVRLMDACTLILTDSGGIQEEAPSLGKPVLVLRDTTERPEAVAAGTVLLVGADRARIFFETCRLLNDSDARCAMSHAHNPYGDGHAARRIVKVLQQTKFF